MLICALTNALAMHASLHLGKNMKRVSSEDADKIGYQMGNHILTNSILIAYCLYSPYLL
jgi:hypothetical protein